MKLKPPVGVETSLNELVIDSLIRSKQLRNESSVLLILERCTSILLLLLMPQKDVKNCKISIEVCSSEFSNCLYECLLNQWLPKFVQKRWIIQEWNTTVLIWEKNSP